MNLLQGSPLITREQNSLRVFQVFLTYLISCTLVYWLRFPLMGLVFGDLGFFISPKFIPYLIEAAFPPAVFGILVVLIWLASRQRRFWHVIVCGYLSFYVLPKTMTDPFLPTFDFYLTFGLPLYCLGAVVGWLALKKFARLSAS